MKKNKSIILFGVFAAIIFVLAAVTSVLAVNAGNDYKTYSVTYNLYEKNNAGIGEATLSAKAESAKKDMTVAKDKLTKYFAISLLLYLALIAMLLAIYMTTVRQEELKNRKE